MPVLVGQVIEIFFPLGKLLGNEREDDEPLFEPIMVLNLAADERGKRDPTFKARLKAFILEGLPGAMRGRTKAAREARRVLVVDFASASVQVRFPNGDERNLNFPQGWSSQDRYQPLWESPLILGRTVYVASECGECDRVTLGEEDTPEEIEYFRCDRCSGDDPGERRFTSVAAVLSSLGSSRRLPPSSLTRVPAAPSGSSTREDAEVPLDWERVPAATLERAVRESLAHLRLHCPYEAHDAWRVLNWCRHHPLHGFDEDALRELVSALLFMERSRVEQLFLFAP